MNDQGLDAAGATLVMEKFHIFTADNVLVADSVCAGNAAGYTDKATAEGTAGFDSNTMVAMGGGLSLYGGSKDVGAISKRLPALSEEGGLVNGIGYSRTTLEGTIAEQGFFSTYTEDSMQFDTDDQLLDHIMTEALIAANELVEDNIQLDLLGAAGIELFAGGVTTIAAIDGNAAAGCIVTYKDLLKMNITLDDNKCPKSTKLISGSRMIDTKVVSAARYCYFGSELLQTLEGMVDLHGNPAWKEVASYARAGNVAVGEEGAIGRTRFIVAPEMMLWEGGGADASTNDQACAVTDVGGTDHFNVAPMLFVGSGAFSTLSFNSSGKSVKFSIIHKKPGVDTADAYNDPYGKLGFMSLRFWYGSLVLRNEWIGLIYTAYEA